MRVIIDGENLRHQLAHVLYMHKKIQSANDYFSFALRKFIEDALGEKKLEIVYVAARVSMPKNRVPVQLKQKISAVNEANRQWTADLKRQNIIVEKAGFLRVKESGKCFSCGKKTLGLQEKGVDVRVGVDLLGAKASSRVVLISSDSDLIPAIVAAKAKVDYFCYAGWLNRAIAANCAKTLTYDDKHVLKHFISKETA